MQRQGGGVIWEDVPLVVGGSCVGVLPFYEVFSPAFAGSSRNVVTLIRCELGRLQLLLCSYDALLDAVEMRPCSWRNGSKCVAIRSLVASCSRRCWTSADDYRRCHQYNNGIVLLSSAPMIRNTSGGVAPTVITATVRIIGEVSATAVKALPVRP